MCSASSVQWILLLLQNFDLAVSVPFVDTEAVPFIAVAVTLPVLVVMFPRLLVELAKEAHEAVELDKAPEADVVLVPPPPSAPLPFLSLFFPSFFPSFFLPFSSFLPFLPLLPLTPLVPLSPVALPAPAAVPLPACPMAVESPIAGAAATGASDDVSSVESTRERET